MKDIVLSGELDSLPSYATYDGNPLLKRAYVKIEYTPWQIEELYRCSRDLEYFAENYIYIIDPDRGKSKIKLREYQIRMLNHLRENRFVAALAPRQIGKSLTISIYVLWYSIFNRDKKSIILANKAATAKEIFQKVKLAYERLPYWMQPGVTQWNVTSIYLENGSDMSCNSTSSSGIRGITCNCLILDEFAFLKRNLAEDFYTSVYPTISASKDSKIIIVSTPNGLNHFHDIWQKAERGKNSYKPFKVNWWEIPGRDEEWLKKTRLDIGVQKSSQEFECLFLGSSLTLITSKILESLEAKNYIRLTDYGLKIYEEPRPGHTYILGIDTARGTAGDYSAIQVLDISQTPINQVAVYSDNTIGTYNFSFIIEKIGQLYNNAYLIIENNDAGSAVIQTLWHEIEYDNIIDLGTNRSELGIRATSRTKTHALDNLKRYIEEGLIIINDQNTIYELSRFIETSPGIFRGEDSEHDDLVTSLYWALFITTLPDYYDKKLPIVSTRERIDIKKEEDIMLKSPNREENDEPLDMFILDEEDDMEIFKWELLQ